MVKTQWVVINEDGLVYQDPVHSERSWLSPREPSSRPKLFNNREEAERLTVAYAGEAGVELSSALNRPGYAKKEQA